MIPERTVLDHLFISPGEPGEGRFVLDGEAYFHLNKVKRARVGEEVSWSDGAGRVGRAIIEGISPASMRLTVVETREVTRRRPSIHLFQSLPKGSKMDGVIRRNVEAGVDGFHPFTSSRSLPKPGRKEFRDKQERWLRVAREASRQSRRDFQPEVNDPVTWAGCLQELRGFTVALVAWEGERVRRVAESLPAGSPDTVALVVGPEGGFTEGEIVEMEGAGAVPVTLGGNILRTENAGMVLAVLVESFYGLL